MTDIFVDTAFDRISCGSAVRVSLLGFVNTPTKFGAFSSLLEMTSFTDKGNKNLCG